ncbi:hypothetical protein GALMADRAFT_223552 [Galerina marginata CBS 339.88]|uniref:Uncharacterized protein n=1 Tax=Galerina marginata (strain CBS 339.88) TaxID=685588 RepID=A0A067T835_GALM3|nr:hypothetical protein GALMADRAFT_223552 [Galerina marginata CBS 339.88]
MVQLYKRKKFIDCECSYVPKAGWQKDFFKQIGSKELTERLCAGRGARGGEEVLTACMAVCQRLSMKAAEELGFLLRGENALIVAYAGRLGTVAA